MGKFLELCHHHFETGDLYEILGVTKKANDEQVKKGYYRQSLKIHPDRVQDKDKSKATEKFQVLAKIYCVLSDKDRRAVYDETGEVDDEDTPADRDWVDYWRLLFPKITIEDIKKFENDYKGSDEEKNDIKKAYIICEGDMDGILERVMCATVEEVGRFSEIIQAMIDSDDVPAFDVFTKESKKKKQERKRKADKEAREAEAAMKEISKKAGTDSLQALILGRQKERQRAMDGFLGNLAAKYAAEDVDEEECMEVFPKKKGRGASKGGRGKRNK